MTDRPDLDAIEALFPAAAYAEATLDTFGWDGLASGERLTVSVRPLLAYARALEQERDYLQERVNDLGEQYAALEQERDSAQADRDALAAGLDAISDILDGMIEGASREETKEALYDAAIKAWEVAARGTFRPNEWWRPFAAAHFARCNAGPGTLLAEQQRAFSDTVEKMEARHDADLWEIVAMLREQARIDWRAAEQLRRVIAEIETAHAAALARHAGRTGGANG